MPSTLSDFLVPEAVHLGVDAQTAGEIIKDIGGRLLRAGYVRETFTNAMLEREKSIPTGLPLSGIYNAAIPHTDAEHVTKSGIGLATLMRPVVFKNMVSPEETVEVRLVFVLALDQPKSQIEMLQEVAQVLQRPEVVNALMKARDLDQVHAALRDAAAEKSQAIFQTTLSEQEMQSWDNRNEYLWPAVLRSPPRRSWHARSKRQ